MLAAGAWLGRVDCQLLRSPAGEFFVYLFLVEAHDPAATDLDHRHTRLPGLAKEMRFCSDFGVYVLLVALDLTLS
jgi:hypothetical protein